MTQQILTQQQRRPPGVMLYFSVYEAVRALSDEQLGILLRSVMDYAQRDEEPHFDGALGMAWSFMKCYVDSDRQRYEDTLERRRNAAERRWDRERERKGVGDGRSVRAIMEQQSRKEAEKPPAVKREAAAVEVADSERPASPEWVKKHMFNGENGAFCVDFSKRTLP